MNALPQSVKSGIWQLARPYYDVRLRVGDLPGCPFVIKPIVGKWSVKVGHAVEWLCGPDTGIPA